MTDALAGHVPRVTPEELSRVDGKLYRDKPTLRLDEHRYAGALQPVADRPLRLERNGDGFYYWSMTRSGEYHWWLTIEFTDATKKEAGSGGLRYIKYT